MLISPDNPFALLQSVLFFCCCDGSVVVVDVVVVVSVIVVVVVVLVFVEPTGATFSLGILVLVFSTSICGKNIRSFTCRFSCFHRLAKNCW